MADIEEKKNIEKEGEAPKKKRFASVVRPQNSSTGKPGVKPGMKRPAPAAAAPEKPAKPRPEVKRHSVRRVENKPEETVEEVKNIPAPADTALAVQPAEKPVTAEGVNTQAEPAPEKPAVKTPRFVDMDAVRANSEKTIRRDKKKEGADKRDVSRFKTTSRPEGANAPGGRDGARGGKRGPEGADKRFNDRGSRNAQGVRGENPFNKDEDNQRPAFKSAKSGAKRPAGGPAADFGGASKNGKSAPNKKERENREKNKQYGKGNLKEENLKNLKKQSAPKKPQPEKKEEVIKTIVLPESLTVGELASKMKVQPAELVKKLFAQGELLTINSDLTFEQAENLAMEYEILCEKEVKVDVIEELLREDEEDEADMAERPPVVCVMGHVDHGKTSLLDAIRNTNVIAREAGGITQHIGAYQVGINGRLITFLDTPGHEAFTAMRLRGAQATDIAIIVVAADDGVMPQTVEAINHAKAAEVDIIVAVNKIDKQGANIDRVKQEMAEYGLVSEDWGGSTVFAPISAKTGEGIDNLLEMVLLTADVKELKANPNRKARGLVIEAKLDKGKGPVATVLVQKGTLHIGDNIAAGSCYGKVRAMIDDKGRKVNEATPSTPVEILGLNDVPNAGEVFVATETDKDARHFAETFIAENRIKMLEKTKKMMTLDSLFTKIQEENIKELNIVVKADVQGSVEAVRQSLEKLSNEEVAVRVIHGGVGAINESDVTLASASNAIIIGFNVRPDATAKSISERDNVDIKLYSVIYQAIADVEAAMKGMLDPVFEEKVIGHAEIRMLFKASGVGMIAGSYVTDGVIQRGCKVRIFRDGEKIFEGALASLKRFKDDVKEVKEKFECGLVFDGFSDFAELDTVEAYTMVEVPR
jgi:translation initiation factor IF-2